MQNDTNMNEEELQKEETENMQTERPAEENNGTNREVEIILELDAKLKAAEVEIADMKDKFIRKSAEFENYKRRTELEQTSLIKYGGELLAMKILPVIDDFDRSQQHVNEATDLQKV
ncbi:MAG: nucleotide exchange factor GrpE, partial [Ignavibacteriales bacterium]|nr:nucleotide exchange factor GrpE [Ignavibacteriales bacterium]